MNDTGFVLPGDKHILISHGFVVLLQLVTFLAKIFALCVFQIQIRWSLPRFRYDQMLSFAWKLLLPVTLVNLSITAVVVWIKDGAP